PAPRPHRMYYRHALHHRQHALARRPHPHGERGAMACGGTSGAGQFVELFADLVDGPLLFALRVSYPHIVVSVDRRGPRAWTCGTRSAAARRPNGRGASRGTGLGEQAILRAEEAGTWSRGGAAADRGPRCLSTSSARPAGTEGWRMATT